MESFESMLMAGGKTNSLGRAEEVLARVRNDLTRLDELFGCISADDAWVRMRAIDAFEKIIRDDPGLIQPYLDRIFNNLAQSDQPSIQWHIAQLFAEVTLTGERQTDAIAWLKSKLETTDVDWIVSVNAMKTLLYFQQKGAVTAAELHNLFAVQEKHVSQSVRKKATGFLRELAAL